MALTFGFFFWGFLISFHSLYYRNLCRVADSGDWIFTPDQIISDPNATIQEPKTKDQHNHEYQNTHNHEYDSSHIPIEWFMWSDL